MSCNHENVDIELIYRDGKVIGRKSKCADCGANL
jgi:hypothetical protein